MSSHLDQVPKKDRLEIIGQDNKIIEQHTKPNFILKMKTKNKIEGGYASYI